MAPPGMKKKQGIAITESAPKGGMKPPGMVGDEPDAEPDAGSGTKHTEAEAHKVASDQHCSDCANYQAESGECSKVEGYWDPQDACVRYFEAGGSDETEPDADDMGGPSDGDADNE